MVASSSSRSRCETVCNAVGRTAAQTGKTVTNSAAVIEGGKVRNHLADGKVVESELATGQTLYREPTTHWAENIGTTTIRLILVELKEHP